ncbi:Carbonyl reductase 3 [Eumeta japonica]|uniref:Carbonyl reductase 3 n=1 Tax=Eumeta variegata TaxID=151549 RepID=A0A4C2A6A2_EUMVA|nr:Carbonyl reductase 3 [Eumeta japonica]
MEMSREKVAVVTGANKGLGYEIVKALCRKNYGVVYLTARNEEKGREAFKKLQELGLKPKFHQLDIQYGKSIHTFVKYIEKKHGGVDVLINNAGVLFLKDAQQPKVYQTDQTLIVNFFSLVDFCETISPLMRNGGCIVNVSSSSGHLSRIPSQRLRERLKDENLSLDELKVLMQGILARRQTFERRRRRVGNLHTWFRRWGQRLHLYYTEDWLHVEGNVLPEQGADVVVQVALSDSRGQYVWHNGTPVPWCGDDPRIWIDGKV